MKPESRVEEITKSILKLAPSEREAYLDAVCGDDEKFRQQVLTSLDQIQQSGDFTTIVAQKTYQSKSGLEPGEFIGPYRIIRVLGRGGMGDVYLAEHMGQNRNVALKMLPADFLHDQQRIQRFRQEARAVIALNHPNIVTVYDMGVAESGYFIATEFVEGTTLRARMAHERLCIKDAVEIAYQIASALAYAHDKGVIHRDIKPENIMLRPDGYVKVLDFGLAKLIERVTPASTGQIAHATTLSQHDTSPGIVMGTVQYMSPEQARGLIVDERTDIWSLGVVLYEMLTGRPAFEAGSQNEVVAAILEREPLPPARFAPDTPPELERIITRALEKNREERYQVIKDLVLDLRNLRQDVELASKIERSRLKEQSSGNLLGGQRSVSSTAELSTTNTVATLGWRRRATAFVMLTALIGLAVVFYRVVVQRSLNQPAPFSSINIARLTSTGKSRLAAISPDGKYVVHVVEEGGKQGLSTTQVATSNNVQIAPPADVNFQGLTFSADGNFVYYIVREQGQSFRDLYQVSALGGPARKLISNVDTAVTFSPDGKRLAFVRRFSDSSEDALIIANVDGSGEQKIFTRKQPDFYSMSGPSWSPDGERIAVGAGSADKDGRYMTVVSVELTNKTEKALTEHRWVGVGRVAWLGSEGNDLLINAVEQTLGLYQILLIGFPAGDVRRVTNDLSDYRDLSLTADANILAVTQSDQQSNLWNFDYGPNSGARQITSGKYDGYYGVAWTPEGQLIYSSSTGGNQDLWQVDADGGNSRRLTVEARSNVWPTVSPDGRYLVFSSDRNGTLHLWRSDRSGANAVQLTHGSGEDWPAFSADGRWLVYTVIGGVDRFTLWKVSIDGGEPVRLIEKFAMQSAVSPDGKLIACGYRPDARSSWKLALIPSEGGQPSQTFEIPQSVELPIVVRWTPDGRALTYIDTKSGISNLWLQSIAGDAAKQITSWNAEQVFSFAWSKDGKHLALARGSRSDDIVLIRDSR